MAPRPASGSAAWLATLAAGLLLMALGVAGVRRSRRTAAVPRN
jgi:LPXTG-motif cell wall-anchored protein